MRILRPSSQTHHFLASSRRHRFSSASCSDGDVADVSDFGSSRRRLPYPHQFPESDHGSFPPSAFAPNSSRILDFDLLSASDPKESRINVTRVASECSSSGYESGGGIADGIGAVRRDLDDNGRVHLELENGSQSTSNKDSAIAIARRRNKILRLAKLQGEITKKNRAILLSDMQKPQRFGERADDICNIGDPNVGDQQEPRRPHRVHSLYPPLSDTRDMASIICNSSTVSSPQNVDSEEENPADALQKRLKNLFLSTAPSPATVVLINDDEISRASAADTEVDVGGHRDSNLAESMDGFGSYSSGSSSSNTSPADPLPAVANEIASKSRATLAISPVKRIGLDGLTTNHTQNPLVGTDDHSPLSPADTNYDSIDNTTSTELRSSGFQEGDHSSKSADSAGKGSSSAVSVEASSLHQTFAEEMHYKSTIRHMIEQVQTEAEQWTQVQLLLQDLREEMVAMKQSREVWESRALNAESELSDLQQTVEKLRSRARDAEEESTKLRAEKKLLKFTIQNMTQKQNAMEVNCREWMRPARNLEYSSATMKAGDVESAGTKREMNAEVGYEEDKKKKKRSQKALHLPRFAVILRENEGSSAGVDSRSSAGGSAAKSSAGVDNPRFSGGGKSNKHRPMVNRFMLAGSVASAVGRRSVNGSPSVSRRRHGHDAPCMTVNMKNCKPVASGAPEKSSALQLIDRMRRMDNPKQRNCSSSGGYGYRQDHDAMDLVGSERMKKARLLQSAGTANYDQIHLHMLQQHPHQIFSYAPQPSSIISPTTTGGPVHHLNGRHFHSPSSSSRSPSVPAAPTSTPARVPFSEILRIIH